jgi:CubicO group peptidase (beta-lactamase class C family)
MSLLTSPRRVAVCCVRRSPVATLSLLLALLLSLAPPVNAQRVHVERVVAQLEPEIERMLLEGSIPSATFALVDGDRVIWSRGFGYSNLWARTPAVPSTVYLIGSTFKTMSTVALLQQMEQRGLRLDDPVRAQVPELTIRGEDPEHPITIRHLLTHTSGLPVTFGPHPVWGETVPLPLEVYLRDSLAVVGPAMDSVRYSNLAYSLVGYLVGKLAGSDFRDYVREHVWEQLEMNNTAFSPTPEMTERLSIPYALDEGGRPMATERLKANVWPAGIVYGTVLDQANWLIANLNGGVFKGRRVVGEEMLRQMHSVQFPNFTMPLEEIPGTEYAYGLTWRVLERRGDRFFTHSGSVSGYTALLMGNLDQRMGVAILTNGHRAHPHLYRLADRALEIMKNNLPPS